MSVGAPERLLEAESAAEAEAQGIVVDIPARSPLELFWRRFRADTVAMISLGVIVLLVLAAIFAPLIIKVVGAPGPNVQNSNALDQFGTPTGPSKNALWPLLALLAGLVLAGIAAALPWEGIKKRGPWIIGGAALMLSVILAVFLWPSAK